MGKSRMRFLSDEEVQEIAAGAIKVLEDVGVKISHDEAKRMLRESGAKVDQQTDLVHVPSKLTEECLRRVPQEIVLGGRDSEQDVILKPGNERVYTRTIGGAEYYVDLHDGR